MKIGHGMIWLKQPRKLTDKEKARIGIAAKTRYIEGPLYNSNT